MLLGGQQMALEPTQLLRHDRYAKRLEEEAKNK